MRRAIRPTLLFTALAAATAALGAQASSPRPYPMPAARNASSDAYIVLDAVTVRESAARTLADLLAGRVTGLAVTYPTGAQGFAPQLRMRGAAGMVGAAEPLLYVDGMLVPDDQYWLGPKPDGHRPSFAWDLPVSEIESVTIVRGQSAGALMEFGAARGAVLVTTRRPMTGSSRVGAFVDVSSSTEGTAFPANFATDGTTGSGPTGICTLSDQSLGNCVATGMRSWNPLERASPFRAARGLRGGVSSAGSVGSGSYRASAAFGRTDGVMSPALNDRLDLTLSYANAPGSRLRLAFDARHARADQVVFPWEQGVLMAGLRGAASDDALRGYATDVDAILDRSQPIHAGRTSVNAMARWSVRPSWDAEARFGVDRYSRHTALTETPFRASSEARQAAWSAEGGVTGEHRIAGGRATVHARLFASRTAYDDSASAIGGLSGSTVTSAPVSSVGVAVSERVRFGAAGQRSLGAGLRASNLSVSGEGIGRGMAHSVEAAWDIAAERFFPRPRFLDHLRFRVAHGSAMDLAPVLGTIEHMFTVSSSDFDPIGNPPLVRETEFGVHSALFGGALTLDLRTFNRRVSDDPVIVQIPATSGFATALSGGHGFETKGEEFRVAIERRSIGPVTVNAALSYATARDRVRDLNTPEFFAGPIDLLPVIVRQGGPLGEIMTHEMSWQDLNGDGVIDQTEVTIDPGLTRQGPMRPTRFVAAAGGLEFGSFSVGAVFDAQGGHKRYDTLFETRCSFIAVCQELHDPSTSLQDQARAVAARYYPQLAGGAHDGDFVRLREAWVRYSIPGGLVPDRLGSARITLAGYQLATWTNYRGLDPEVGVSYGSSMLFATPFGQPLVPTWSLRLELGR